MRNKMHPSHSNFYEIRIRGLLGPHWEWLEGLTVIHLDAGETLLSGPIVDQAALHGLLARIRDLNLTLISVEQQDELIQVRIDQMDKVIVEISKDVALQLCDEIRQKYQGKWWTLAGMQCMGCTAASKGNLTRRCISNAPGYRGCNLVNARYDRQANKVS